MVESRLGRAHIEAFAYVELGLLGINTFGIGLVILLEILRGCGVVAYHILRHGKHVEAVLRVLGAFLLRDDRLEYGDGLVILSVGESFLGVLVLIKIVVRLVYVVEFLRATREE